VKLKAFEIGLQFLSERKFSRQLRLTSLQDSALSILVFPLSKEFLQGIQMHGNLADISKFSLLQNSKFSTALQIQFGLLNAAFQVCILPENFSSPPSCQDYWNY